MELFINLATAVMKCKCSLAIENPFEKSDSGFERGHFWGNALKIR